jgi:hypothetical protein
MNVKIISCWFATSYGAYTDGLRRALERRLGGEVGIIATNCGCSEPCLAIKARSETTLPPESSKPSKPTFSLGDDHGGQWQSNSLRTIFGAKPGMDHRVPFRRQDIEALLSKRL